MLPKKSALAMAIGLACAAPSFAQMATEEGAERVVILEEIVVLGVRGSQARSIDIKRNAAVIVDSIVAEDIGKLPDITITDSLQRITGVQIRREANEGTSLNVRGMPQVLTTLNGEQFLSPWNITDVGANYGDVPAGMISGTDVYKSMSGRSLAGGISGLVDLKTFRPLSLDEGWTGKLRLEASQGQLSNKQHNSDGALESRSPDPNISVFVAHNHDDRFGVSLGAFKNTSYAANYKVSAENQRLGFTQTPNGVPGDPFDLNNDGDLVTNWYLVPSEYGASSSFMERERQGGSTSFEFAINDNFTLRGDAFYTRMDQHDRGVRAVFNGADNINSFEVNGERPRLEAPYYEYGGLYNVVQPGSEVREAGTVNYVDAGGNLQTRTLHTLQVAHIESVDFMSHSDSQINRTAALNTNLELLYTNHDNFDGSVRMVYADAAKQYRRSEFKQGTPAWLWIDQDGIQGKDPIDPYYVTVDYRGQIPSYSFSDDLSSPEFLEQYQASAQGQDSDAKMAVLRADGTFYFGLNDWFESVDFGMRYGSRQVDHSKFWYVAPTARYSNYEDMRVSEDQRFRLRTGNEIWQKYPEWRRFDIADEDQRLVTIGGLEDNDFGRNYSMPFTDFGPIQGFGGGVSALNPAVWDNPLEFMNALYPGTKTVAEPGETYTVEEASSSLYGQLNFHDDRGVLGVPFSGNVGLNLVRTEREVVRSVIPEVLNRFNSIGYDDWQKVAFVSETDTIHHSFTDVLPSLNINFFPADDVIVRFGAARTMTRNDLNNVGRSLELWYTRCPKTDEQGRLVTVRIGDGEGTEVAEEVACVGGGSDGGDPKIKPWRATVYNLSSEWYFAENAILGAGLFLIDIASSVESFQERRSFVDGDGVDRGRTANLWVSQNSEASELYGLEIGYKQPLSFLPGDFLSSTGIELNYTYSQSESKDFDLNGKAFPLNSNSEHQSNFILWYDRSGLNVRLAYNWRSREYLGRATLNTSEAPLNLGAWQKPTGYLDLSVHYWVNDHLSLYFNGTNLTEQHQESYSQFKDQFRAISIQERRFAAGISLSL